MPVPRHFLSKRLSVIDRYLLREFAANLLGVTAVLWLIYVATRFARYLADAAVGRLPAEVIVDLLGYSSLGALSVLLPIATFLAVMLGLSRLSNDNELTVMAACGVPAGRTTRNVLLFSGVLAVVIGILSVVVVPNLMSNRDMLEQKSKMAASTTGLIAGTFKESQQGKWTFYSQGVSDDKQDMENIFIQIRGDAQQRPLTFRAKRGHFEIDNQSGDKYLVLENGYRYEGDAGQQDFVIAEYASHSLLVEKGNKQAVAARSKYKPTLELWQSGRPDHLAEVQWRFATPIMTVILSLIAITLANSGPRQGRYAGFFPAVLVYILYSNLLAVSQAWIAKGTVSLWFGALWVHLLMLATWLLYENRHQLKSYLVQRQSLRKAV